MWELHRQFAQGDHMEDLVVYENVKSILNKYELPS
jgi:hypothetical protein